MHTQRSHWTHAGLTFFLTVLAAGIFLPWIRVHPESVHQYFNGLNDWLRIAFVFCLCVVFTSLMFKLLSPRIGQLEHWKHWKSCPPAWLAALLGAFVAAIVDIFGGFQEHGYRTTCWEWLGYGGGSLVIVGWYSGLWSAIVRWRRMQKPSQAEPAKTITVQDFENAPWEEIEKWLESDAPAQYDFLGNRTVADRLSRLLANGTRSIGIVGRFGAGKTTLVLQIEKRLKANESADRRYFVCRHSCWGFETSASAIHDMLRSAISQIGAVVDTFEVDSLPEAYRQTFSAGGDWLKTISNLVLRNPDPMEQFSRLDDLLEVIGGRLVFIVEDLDRNETRNFEIQEVLAFLERLKEYPHLSFVLTGGLSSSQSIDYSKLCDHIESMKTMQPRQSSGLITRVRERCRDNAVFPHVALGDENQDYEWNPLRTMFKRNHEELDLLQAVSCLLNTPRSLRHALGRTLSAWQTLYGEIAFDHLLGVNILRFGAPECFNFLIRRWDRLHSRPDLNRFNTQARIDGIRQAIFDDWNRTIENVEWNPTAAIQVMQSILPATEYWLVDAVRSGNSQRGWQQVSEERYWNRAVNEAIDDDDVRDQEVIRDMQAWTDAPGTTTDLVRKLTSLPHYANIWEKLADALFAQPPDDILLLCEQVITRILDQEKASACDCSQGFVHTWRFASGRIRYHPHVREWLQDRISEAADWSIEMVNALWHYYCTPGKQYSVLRMEDAELVRGHVVDTMRARVVDGSALIARLCPNVSKTLCKLVFDPGDHDDRILADACSWSWLSPHVLAALKSRNVLAALNCGALLDGRASKPEQVSVNPEVLDQFFGDDANEVIDLLESMIDQFPEAHQSHVKNLIGAARRYLTGGTVPETHAGEIDHD